MWSWLFGKREKPTQPPPVIPVPLAAIDNADRRDKTVLNDIADELNIDRDGLNDVEFADTLARELRRRMDDRDTDPDLLPDLAEMQEQIAAYLKS